MKHPKRPASCVLPVLERLRLITASLRPDGNFRRHAARLAGAGLLPLAMTAQTASTGTASAGDQAEILTLSPFTVTAGSEQGYVATQTLNGTRLKSSMRDIGAAMTIFTDELMDDLAASSVLDLAKFAPNTDTYVGNISDTAGAGNEFLTTQAPQYVTRGGTTGLISQDFFSTPTVSPDRYNAENFTFTRGPNAILFGLGNPAGAFVSSTKRARFHNRRSVEARGDSEGGLRLTVDVNQVLVPRKLALRYAGLHEESEGFREPSGVDQRRHYLTALFTPFPKTSVRLNYETGKAHTIAVRPWPVYDGITPWMDAGMPLLSRAKSANNSIPGITRAYANANQSLIYTADTAAGTVVPAMSWALQGRSANPSFPNYPGLGNNVFRSLVNPALLPVETNVAGAGSFRDLDFDSGAIFVEQQVTRNLFLEAAVSRVKSDTMIVSGVGGSFERLFVDVNQQLPNGAPNPNVGMFYVDSFANVLPNRYENTTKRLMLSYDLDFQKLWPKHGAWFGRHRIAAMIEDGTSDTWGGQNPSHNLTPLPGSSPNIFNLQNRVIFRSYIDPGRGVFSAGTNLLDKYPLIFAGTQLPAANPSGVTPGFAAIFGGTAAKTELTTRMIASQSSFWKDRIVVTYGLRQDEVVNYRGQQADFAPYADARGLYPDARLFDAKRDFPNSRDEQSGHTFTRGIVFHALPWVSLTFNKSNNLVPNSTVRDIAGNLLPNQEGDGEDYGLKFFLADGRIIADVVYYRNYSRNKPDAAVANGVHGNFQNPINAIWTTIAGVENDSKYLDQPYAFTGSVWQDVNTGYSDGVEFSVTTNLTPRWRLTLNASRRGSGETQGRGTLAKAYLAEALPLWKSNSTWMSAPLAGGSGTVAEAVALIETTLASFNALADLPSDSLLSPVWSSNLVTAYDFPKESRLRGFSLGASANVRGRTVIGFAEVSGGRLDADKPYYADEFSTVGAWISYRRKLFGNKVDWRIQLNVRNLFDSNKLFPNRMVDRRDGTGTGEVVIYRLNQPRTFLLTSAFAF